MRKKEKKSRKGKPQEENSISSFKREMQLALEEAYKGTDTSKEGLNHRDTLKKEAEKIVEESEFIIKQEYFHNYIKNMLSTLSHREELESIGIYDLFLSGLGLEERGFAEPGSALDIPEDLLFPLTNGSMYLLSEVIHGNLEFVTEPNGKVFQYNADDAKNLEKIINALRNDYRNIIDRMEISISERKTKKSDVEDNKDKK